MRLFLWRRRPGPVRGAAAAGRGCTGTADRAGPDAASLSGAPPAAATPVLRRCTLSGCAPRAAAAALAARESALLLLPGRCVGLGLDSDDLRPAACR
jgi:hypothetical protein